MASNFRSSITSSSSSHSSLKRKAQDSSYCSVCDIDFVTPKAMVKHMQENGYPCNRPMVRCSFCNTFWANAKCLQIHQERNNACMDLQDKQSHNESLQRFQKSSGNALLQSGGGNRSQLFASDFCQCTNSTLPKCAAN